MYQGKMPGAHSSANRTNRREPPATALSKHINRLRCIGWVPSVRHVPLLMMALASGCSDRVVPQDAVLTVTPDAHETTVIPERDDYGRCQLYADRFMDIPLHMQLSTADGTPIGNATLAVHADFTAQSFSGYPLVQLFDDRNGNGVVDEQSELVSGEDHDAVTVKTDRWSGARGLLLRINLSCAFKSDVLVLAGGVSGRASIEVSEIDPFASLSTVGAEELRP